jgi:hypothetical protein
VTVDALIPVEAGQVYACGKGRFRRVEQVRETGHLRGGGGGLKYALVRVCGPKGRTHDHPFLKDDPITVFLLPDGSMPAGYLLTQGEPEPDAPQPEKSTTMSANAPTPTTEAKHTTKLSEEIANVTQAGKHPPAEKKAKATKVKTAKPKQTAAPKKEKERDLRLPGAGAKIRGNCGGKEYEATVLKDGFEFKGKHYSSISALATEIRGGTSTNGFLFFGLIPTEKKAAPKKAAKKGHGCSGVTADHPKKSKSAK